MSSKIKFLLTLWSYPLKAFSKGWHAIQDGSKVKPRKQKMLMSRKLQTRVYDCRENSLGAFRVITAQCVLLIFVLVENSLFAIAHVQYSAETFSIRNFTTTAKLYLSKQFKFKTLQFFELLPSLGNFPIGKCIRYCNFKAIVK